MKYVLLIIFSALLSNESINSSFESNKTFSKNKFYKKENIYNKYDSLLKEINLIKQSIYDIQDSINANTVKQKKLRLRYIGHNSKLKEMSDTTLKIKNRASLFKRNTNSQIKGLESELVYSQQMMNEQDSVNASEVSDLQDRFITFQSAQKIKNRKLENKDSDYLDRLNELEKKINELESRLPKEDK